MKKIYTKRIIQYSLDGKKLNTFEYVNDALEYARRDSILSCCVGNIKTSNGYVWRFEGDEFSLKSKRDKTIEFNCKICGSGETIRGMAMHLRFVHNIKSDEYIKKHGEFRPKKINENNIKNKADSLFVCKICNDPQMHNRQLMYHITKKHPETTHEEYIVKYIYNGKHPLCKCGCGGKVTISKTGYGKGENHQYHNEYIKGHWDWVKPGWIEHTDNTKLLMREIKCDSIKLNKNYFEKISKVETELVDFIKLNFQGEVILNDRKLLHGKELDIVIPSKNIAIEFNGVHYHSDLFKEKNYHINKTKECEKQGIRLIHIWENDWHFKRDIIKSNILSILGLIPNKIYARKCLIKQITLKESSEFLIKNHLQQSCLSKVNLGLYYNNELVSVMTFGKLRKNLGNISKENQWELLRFCNKIDTIIIGGSSKLYKYFLKLQTPNTIISYANRDWSQGKMYEMLGMELVKICPPGYWYVKSMIKYNRFTFRKDILIKQGYDPNKTEKQIMAERGFHRIWNTGNLKYEYNGINSME